MSLELTAEDYRRGAELWCKLAREAIPTEINRMSLTEWARRKRVLGADVSSSPGAFNWEVTPFWRELADALSETSPVRKLVLMKGSQIGATTAILENMVGYIIDCAPGPALYVSGDAQMAQSQMNRRIDALLFNAGLQDKIQATVQGKSRRKSGDTLIEKQFPGGFIRAVGPHSSSKLRSDSIRYLLADEVDAYPESAGREGDPTALAERRTDAFEQTRKLLYLSTPGLDHTSKIKPLYERGDRRRYYVPCCHCGAMQPLEFSQLKWKTDDEGNLLWHSVHYECVECGGHWRNEDKTWFLPRGEWRPTAEAKEPGLRSYHLSSLYSPVGFRSWESGVSEFLDAKDDADALQVWKNTFLGEPFQDYTVRPKVEHLITSPKDYHIGELPADARPLFATLGADVHKETIFAEVVAWGRDFESWSINYFELPCEEGETTESLDATPWAMLRDIINSKHAGLDIVFAGIDAGYYTETVHEFADTFEKGVAAVMGFETLSGDRDYVRITSTEKGAGIRVDVATDRVKSQLYGFINASAMSKAGKPRGALHFPMEYTRKHYHALTAEDKVQVRRGGRIKTEWRRGSRNNEPLDCRAYSLAMVHLYRLAVSTEHDLDQFKWPDFWDYAERMAGLEPESDDRE